TLPARLGRWIEDRPRLFKALDHLVNRGRRVKTGTVRWFLPLYLLGGLKRFRRGTLRHHRELAHLNAWLDLAKTIAARDYSLAVEIVETRRLVKGYPDTHARGTSTVDKAIAAATGLDGRPPAAEWVRRQRPA